MIHFSSNKDLLLKGLDLFLKQSGAVTVYIKQGDYIGKENNSSSWTLLGNYSIAKSNNSLTSNLTLNSPLFVMLVLEYFYLFNG
jgi:hypothetical protein